MGMTNEEYVQQSRSVPDRVILRNRQFAKWVARRKGVSADALASAITLLCDGIIEAMAEGYEVMFVKIGSFQARELKPRKRYHRKEGRYYMSNPSLIVHFHKAEKLNERLRAAAAKNVQQMVEDPTVNPLKVKK